MWRKSPQSPKPDPKSPQSPTPDPSPVGRGVVCSVTLTSEASDSHISFSCSSDELSDVGIIGSFISVSINQQKNTTKSLSQSKHSNQITAIKAHHSPPYGGGARGWGFCSNQSILLPSLRGRGRGWGLLLLRRPDILNLQLHHVALEHIVLNSISNVEAAL